VKALLDTCVLTELGKDDGNPAVKAAVADIAVANLYLSVLTVGEIAKGVARLAAGRKKTLLGTWLARVENQYADRILGIDVETARLWGEITARAQKSGIIIPSVDGLLAATALRHGLHVMTRNTRHFEASGALVIDPWQDS
jgi:predicted nucleic acid-binding protein